MSNINLSLEFEWKPFLTNGAHFTYLLHRDARLSINQCNHWGPAIYKWEGVLTDGPHRNSIGVLIGETNDIRARIKQYISGTQVRGNLLWRTTFLEQGNIKLYVLEIINERTTYDSREVQTPIDLTSNGSRIALEQLLISRELATRSGAYWIVNARQ